MGMRIPRDSGERVQDASLPNVDMSVRPPSGVFGGNAAEGLGKTVRSGLGTIEAIIEKQQKEADEVVQLEAGSLATQKEIQWKQRTMSTRGKDAFNLDRDFEEDWKNFESDVDKNLVKNDRQRAMVNRVMMTNKNRIYSDIQTHQFKEQEQYYKDQSASYIDSERKAAVTSMDSMRVAESIGNQRAVIQQNAKKFGWPAEKESLELAAVEEKTHIDVLNAMKNFDPEGALAYYDQHKDIIGATVKRPALVKEIEDIEKAKKIEFENFQVKNEIEAVNALANGGKIDVNQIAMMAAEQKIRPEFAHAMVRYATDPELMDNAVSKKVDSEGFYRYAQEMFKVAEKDPKKLNDVLMSALMGGKYKRISKLDLARLVAAASEAGDKKFTSTMEGIAKWAESAKFTPEQIAAVTGAFMDEHLKKDERTDAERVNKVQRDAIIKQNPELAQFEDVPNFVVSADSPIRFVFPKKGTNIYPNRIFNPASGRLEPNPETVQNDKRRR